MIVFALLSLVSAIVTFALANFIFNQNPKEKLNRLFAILAVFLSLWAFGEFMMRMSRSARSAYIWLEFSALWWALPSSFLLHFVLIYTGKFKYLKSKVILFLIYTPAAVFTIIDFFTPLLSSGVQKSYWGYTYSISPNSVLYWISNIWIFGVALFSLYLSTSYYFKEADRRRKSQAKYITIGIAVPIIASMSEMLPESIHSKIPELTAISFGALSVFIGYAIWKYDLFISPVTIVNKITDSIVLLDNKARISMANKITLSMLGYKKSELEGHFAEILFQDRQKYLTVINKLQKGELVEDIDLEYRKKDKTIIPVIFSSSIVRGKKDEEVGFIFAAKDVTERKRTENILKESEEKYRTLTEASPDSIFVINRDDKISFVNKKASKQFNAEPSLLIGKYLSDIFPTDEFSRLKISIEKVFSTGKALYKENEITFDSQKKWISIWFAPIKDKNGNISALLGISRDITERKKMEEKNDYLASFPVLNPNPIFEVTFEGNITYINPRTEKQLPDILEKGLEHPMLSGFNSIVEEIKQRKYLVRDVDVYDEAYSQTISLVPGEEKIRFYNLDITNRKKAEQKIEHLVFYDPITDLPNRLLFNDILAKALDEAKNNGQNLAVLFLDLQNFKSVKNTLGNDFAEKLTKKMIRQFEKAIKHENAIGRIGEDEYLLFLPAARNQDAEEFAKIILRMFNYPWSVNDQQANITANIGIAVFPDDGKDAETLQNNADTAMISAMKEGPNRYKLFEKSMLPEREKTYERLIFTSDLGEALKKEEFVVYYQPIVDIKTGLVTSMEALVRWKKPGKGIVEPDEFVYLAEKTGQIIPLGDLVLSSACRQNKKWQEAGFAPLKLSVNISAKQFIQKNLAQKVTDIIKQTQLSPDYLQLEITESAIMINPKLTDKIINKLDSKGITISIDDFGSGYSSLTYLKTFLVSNLKIDSSFIRDLDVSRSDKAIVKSMITLAHGLGFKVIAEGVEKEEHLSFLRQNECDYAQGFLFSEPVSAKEFEELFLKKEGKAA